MTGNTWRGTAVVALQQVALAAILFVLLVCWLQIPDANAFEVLASVLVALSMALVAGAGESAIVLRLVQRQLTARRLLLGAGAVLMAAVLWLALSLGLDHLAAKQSLWAGYLNSRFPASLRNVFSYARMYLWMGWLCTASRWIGAGLLASGAFAAITCKAPATGMLAIFRSAGYWLALILLVVAGAVLTDLLLSWAPGHGLAVETISLLLRIVCVVMLNAFAVGWLLQSMASAILCVQPAGRGDPVASQLRTDGMP